jgi:hypothetical protein
VTTPSKSEKGCHPPTAALSDHVSNCARPGAADLNPPAKEEFRGENTLSPGFGTATARRTAAFFAGRLFRRLPARLADLPDDTRELIGKALDRRLVRLALDDDGGALVLRGIGR